MSFGSLSFQVPATIRKLLVWLKFFESKMALSLGEGGDAGFAMPQVLEGKVDRPSCRRSVRNRGDLQEGRPFEPFG